MSLNIANILMVEITIIKWSSYNLFKHAEIKFWSVQQYSVQKTIKVKKASSEDIFLQTNWYCNNVEKFQCQWKRYSNYV